MQKLVTNPTPNSNARLSQILHPEELENTECRLDLWKLTSVY